mmetsp:Transcript_32918/g.70075  ORF Transcript_32918/g.70075 Transcript_32918/m.70075 type:complete len:256 (-) Transcript_32918:414-1181(-)
MREHRLQNVSRLDDVTLIESRPVACGRAMTSQHELESVPRHDVVDETPSRALHALLSSPAPSASLSHGLLHEQGGELGAVDPLLFGQCDRTVLRNSHAVFGVHGLDRTIHQQLGLRQEGLHVFVGSLPRVLGKFGVGNVPVWIVLELGLGTHSAVPLGVGILEVEVSPLLRVGRSGIAKLEVVENGRIRATLGRREGRRVLGPREDVVGGVDQCRWVIAFQVNDVGVNLSFPVRVIYVGVNVEDLLLLSLLDFLF